MKTENYLTLLHGYHLDGSGSCIYVQNVTRELARQGRNVALICQEPEIEAYEFVSSAYECDENGELTLLFDRPTEYRGDVVYIRPHLKDGLLPVFVAGRFPGFENVKAFVDLSDEELQSYIDTNVTAVLAALENFPSRSIFANHIVMTPYIALQACRAREGVEFFLIPHGSEIEYLIKKDPRYFKLAEEVLDHSARIVSGSQEMIERINGLFEDATRYAKKYHLVSVGVDVDQFAAPLKLTKAERADQLRHELQLQLDQDDGPVNAANPGFLNSLDRIDFKNSRVLVNFGKLIPGKGVQDLLTVAPRLLQSVPDLHIVIAGDGPSRDLFTRLLSFLQAGDHNSFFATVAEDTQKSAQAFDDPYRFITAYFEKEPRERFFETSASFQWIDRIHFTGYLKHAALRYLLCLSDVAVFPSIVKEAYPLALLEAMGTGVFPIASDYGGLKDGVKQLDGLFPREIMSLMKIPMDESQRLIALQDHVIAALDFHNEESRNLMVERISSDCSWETVCRKLYQV